MMTASGCGVFEVVVRVLLGAGVEDFVAVEQQLVAERGQGVVV